MPGRFKWTRLQFFVKEMTYFQKALWKCLTLSNTAVFCWLKGPTSITRWQCFTPWGMHGGLTLKKTWHMNIHLKTTFNWHLWYKFIFWDWTVGEGFYAHVRPGCMLIYTNQYILYQNKIVWFNRSIETLLMSILSKFKYCILHYVQIIGSPNNIEKMIVAEKS